MGLFVGAKVGKRASRVQSGERTLPYQEGRGSWGGEGGGGLGPVGCMILMILTSEEDLSFDRDRSITSYSTCGYLDVCITVCNVSPKVP